MDYMAVDALVFWLVDRMHASGRIGFRGGSVDFSGVKVNRSP